MLGTRLYELEINGALAWGTGYTAIELNEHVDQRSSNGLVVWKCRLRSKNGVSMSRVIPGLPF